MTGTTLKDRTLVRIAGEEARPFLQGILTQDVLKLQSGQSRYGAMLTGQGKLLFDLIIWGAPDNEDDILLDCESERVEALVKKLMMYRLRRKVTIGPDPDLAVHWSLAEDAPGAPDPRLAALGRRWLAPAEEGDASEAFRAHRLSLSVVEGTAEMGEDKTLWLECNGEEMNGVDYRKGCYVGQENTARMHYRSKVNRRLVVLPLDQSDPARQRASWPELGLAVDHRKVETLGELALPAWLKAVVPAADTAPPTA
jgi:folate-binding protein YgfZ